MFQSFPFPFPDDLSTLQFSFGVLIINKIQSQRRQAPAPIFSVSICHKRSRGIVQRNCLKMNVLLLFPHYEFKSVVHKTNKSFVANTKTHIYEHTQNAVIFVSSCTACPLASCSFRLKEATFLMFAQIQEIRVIYGYSELT